MTNRTVLVRLRADVSDFVAKSALAKAAVRDLHQEIDKSNDRTAWLAQGILALTPAVTRLGAGAVPVLSGMATQMMLTVAAAGTMALAFNGVGDALGALNDYQLDPTAENLKQLNDAMAKIGPAGQEFVEFLDSMGPALSELSNTAREGMFPGLTSGLKDLMTLAPELNAVVQEISEGLGQLGAEAGEGISGERFADFFAYLDTRAKPILVEMGRTLGNFADGFLNMLVAFDPLTKGFSEGLLEMSRSFVAWSDGLESSAGFQEFLAYVKEAGPQALDFLAALINFFVELAEAAAPVGAVMLPLLTGMLNILGDLANTPLGPATVAVLAYTSAVGRLSALSSITGAGVVGKLTQGVRDNATATRAAVPTLRQFGNAAAFAMTSTDALVKSSWSYSQAANKSAFNALKSREAVKSFGRTAAPIAGQLGLLAVAMSDVDDKMGLTNTTTLALTGSLLGPWGAAAGGAIGLMMDLSKSTGGFKVDAQALTETLDQQTGAITANTTAYAANELERQGVLAAAQDLGLSLADVTQAALGDAAAQDRITASLASQDAAFFDANGRVLVGTEALMDHRESAGLVGDAIGVMSGELATGESSIGRVAVATAAATAETDGLTAAQARAAAAAKVYQRALERLNTVLEGRASLRDYEAALDDFAQSIKDNGRSFDITTEKGRKNQEMLDGIATTAVRVADGLKGAARQRFLTGAIKDLEAAATKFDIPKAQVNDLIELLKRANNARVNPKISADTIAAMTAIERVRAALFNLEDKTVTVRVTQTGAGVSPGFGPVGSADGSFVPKTGLPYADRHLYMLADGEGVTTNRRGETDRFKDVITGINAGLSRRQIKGMLADGGFGGPGRPNTGNSSGNSIDSMTAGMLAYQVAANQQLLTAAEAQLEAAEKQQDAAQAQVDGTKALMSSLASATTSGFQTSLFANDTSSAWGAGAGGGWLSNLSTDISGLQKRGELQAQLGLAGLDGDALIAALSEGSNEDLAALLAGGQVQMFEDMFNQRAALTNSVGSAAGQQVFGAQLASQQASLDQTAAGVSQLNNSVYELTAVLGRLEGAAADREAAADARAERQGITTGEVVGQAIVNGGNRVARRGTGGYQP